MMSKISVVIPAYEPDERLIELLNDLNDANIGPIYIVDDGSGSDYRKIFEQVAPIIEHSGGMLLTHEVNKGKGRALKTAFQYILEKDPETTAVVTADSDGQHTPKCIKKVIDAMRKNSDCLILGVRDFNETDIPWKSRFGNKLTEKVFKYLTGISLSDTQTGLRGIPRSYMRDLLKVKGERFEYEMRMLLDAADNIEIVTVSIETIYVSIDNHQTHFKPIKDSLRIYRILGEKFIKYLFSSLSSSILDLVIFAVGCYLLRNVCPAIYVAVSTVGARIISAVYNYIINYKVVFKSKANVGFAALKYITLAVIQMLCSALFVTLLVILFPFGKELLFKVIVDGILFFISYYVQQKIVFKK